MPPACVFSATPVSWRCRPAIVLFRQCVGRRNFHPLARTAPPLAEPVKPPHVGTKSRTSPRPRTGSAGAPPQSTTGRAKSHGLLFQGHQNARRPLRAHAARHLLRREADREGAAEDDRQGDRSRAQGGLREASRRKPRAISSASSRCSRCTASKAKARELPGDRRHPRGGRRGQPATSTTSRCSTPR